MDQTKGMFTVNDIVVMSSERLEQIRQMYFEKQADEFHRYVSSLKEKERQLKSQCTSDVSKAKYENFLSTTFTIGNNAAGTGAGAGGGAVGGNNNQISKTIEKSKSQTKEKNDKKKKQDNLDELKKGVQMDEHKIPLEELLARYETSLEFGLSDEQAEIVFKRDGPNTLQPPREIPEWVKFLRQLFSGFSNLLWAAAVLSMIGYAISYTADPNPPKDPIWLAVVLASVCILTACFAYYQESKSGAIMETFKKLVPKTAIVLRNGNKIELPCEQLVVGDVVDLKYGDIIPADVRIVKSSSFKVDNSSLTGESEPQTRTPEFTNDNPLETKNLAFFSTNAMEGTAVGIVVNTADRTVMGGIANLVSNLSSGETTLSREIAHVVHIITFLAITFGIIFLIVALAQGAAPTQAIIFLIGIIVGNVPEGLLSSVTICLTISAKRMAAKNCFVKNLETVETLGSTTTICSDKTGTLTQNRMTVSHLWIDNAILVAERVGEEPTAGWPPLSRIAMLCNRAEFISGQNDKPILKRDCNGDASESAILKMTEMCVGGVMEYRQKNPKVCEVPFNSTNKYQLSIHRTNEEENSHFVLVMKGAPERIVERCSTILINGIEEKLTAEWKEAFEQAYFKLGGIGERVLGFCDYILPDDQFPSNYEFNMELENFPTNNLRFIGLISMIDPPKVSVPDAVAKCRTAGIRVIMVTGDHPITAEAIAKAVGIISSSKSHNDTDPVRNEKRSQHQRKQIRKPRSMKHRVIPGSVLRDMSSKELDMVLRTYEEIVFARISPQEKLVIVESCQRLGDIVAVTGDGVNDSPALKKADIGVSMGITGSDISKQAADMILLDDNFSSIVTGVECGRVMFDNLKKTIAFTLTHSFPEFGPFLAYVAIGLPLPMTSITVLVWDMGTDMLPSVNLAYELAESDVMSLPPRNSKTDRLVNDRLISLVDGQIGMIELAAEFFGYFVMMATHGFWPLDLLFLRPKWDSPAINNLIDSYGQEWTYTQRKTLEYSCYAQCLVAVVICQCANAICFKTRRQVVFYQGMKNHRLTIAIFASILLAAFVLYCPGLNIGLQMRPIRFVNWLVGFPFAIYLSVYDFGRKILIERFGPGNWLEQETYY